jgi:hypothetical protein
MRKRAWAAIYPRLNDGFSLANFLWELRDFQHLWKTSKKLGSLIRKAGWGDLPSLTKLFGSKTAAELHLSYSFGIKPMVSDISSLVGSLFNIDDIVDEFIKEGKEPQSYHYREDLWRTTQRTNTYWGHWTKETEGLYAATCRMRYLYVKPEFLTASRIVLGLRLTPENIWNAIPWSFVIDWVLGIGKCLRQFDEDPHLLACEVLDYCDSVKSTSKTKLVRDRSTGTSYSSAYDYSLGDVHYPLWEWTRSRYIRSVGLPATGYAFPVLDSMSLRELMLSASLARTR